MKPHKFAAFITLACSCVLASAQIVDYQVAPQAINGNIPRTFNFDSSRPWLNPTIGTADMATIQYAGKTISSNNMVEDPNCEADASSHICRYQESATGDWLTRVRLFHGEPKTGESQRTQLNSYPLEAQKRYVLDLEFKLDQTWDTNMPQGAGTIWQLKDDVKTCQKGNPILGLNLYGNQLQFDVLYPTNAASAQQWPVPGGVCWGYAPQQDPAVPVYVAFNQAKQTIIPGQYHRIQLVFFADDTPRNSYINSGRGFITAYFDGKPWFSYLGPTLQPDSLIPHKVSWGWYQWQSDPVATRVIYYRKHRLYEWK